MVGVTAFRIDSHLRQKIGADACAENLRSAIRQADRMTGGKIFPDLKTLFADHPDIVADCLFSSGFLLY